MSTNNNRFWSEHAFCWPYSRRLTSQLRHEMSCLLFFVVSWYPPGRFWNSTLKCSLAGPSKFGIESNSADIRFESSSWTERSHLNLTVCGFSRNSLLLSHSKVFARVHPWTLPCSTPYAFITNFNIILQITRRSRKWFLPSGIPTKILHVFLISPSVLHVSPLISIWSP
jgi:hypothetical protein